MTKKFSIETYRCYRHEGSFFMTNLFDDNEKEYHYFPVDDHEDVFTMIQQKDFPVTPNWEIFTRICTNLGYEYPNKLIYNKFFDKSGRLPILKRNILKLTYNPTIPDISKNEMKFLLNEDTKEYLRNDNWMPIISTIKSNWNLNNFYWSYLGDEWFDSTTYLPRTEIELFQLNVSLKLDYFFTGYRINFFISNKNGKLSHQPNHFNCSWDCYDYSDIDKLLSDLHEEALECDKNIARVISSNHGVLKEAIELLFEKNYSPLDRISSDSPLIVDGENDIISEETYYFPSTDVKSPLNSTLKELDIRTPLILSLKMRCKIKNIKQPKLVTKTGPYFSKGEYYQKCVVYDDNTNKTIKAILTDDVADFDEWTNGSDVELYGTFDLRLKYPLVITNMKVIKTEDNPQIIPNRSQETPGYDAWRDAVIERDKVCQCCGLDKHLEAHHMFGYAEYPELATDINNGIVLCKFCHDKYHSIYGLKNINPRDLVEFIKDFGVVRK